MQQLLQSACCRCRLACGIDYHQFSLALPPSFLPPLCGRNFISKRAQIARLKLTQPACPPALPAHLDIFRLSHSRSLCRLTSLIKCCPLLLHPPLPPLKHTHTLLHARFNCIEIKTLCILLGACRFMIAIRYLSVMPLPLLSLSLSTGCLFQFSIRPRFMFLASAKRFFLFLFFSSFSLSLSQPNRRLPFACSALHTKLN